MDDVGALRSPLEVVESSDEREDRVRVIRDSEIRPPGVVELLHLAPVCTLGGEERERERGREEGERERDEIRSLIYYI